MPAARLLTGEEAERALAGLGEGRQAQYGLSGMGRPLWAWQLPARQPEQLRVLAYGYAHPDEPQAASALPLLAERAQEYPQVSWCLVGCADPDGARRNQEWIRQPLTLSGVARGSWRPMREGAQLDYSFPVEARAHYHPPQGVSGKPPARPESLALAALLEEFSPDLVVSGHGSVLSGSFDYSNHSPSHWLQREFRRLDQRLGIPRHRGEQTDPGTPWQPGQHDWLAELSLDERQQSLEARLGRRLRANERFAGGVSLAQWMETRLPGASVLTPEAPLFTHPDWGDPRPCGSSRGELAGRALARSERLTSRLEQYHLKVEESLEPEWRIEREETYSWLSRTRAQLSESLAHSQQWSREASRAERACWEWRARWELAWQLGQDCRERTRAGLDPQPLQQLWAELELESLPLQLVPPQAIVESVSGRVLLRVEELLGERAPAHA